MSERKDVPYIVYENEMFRHERTVKRLLIVLCIACLMIVFTNTAWLYVFSQYDYETYEVSSEEGNANYVGGNSGDLNNGQGESKETN
jgi:hypothetical protein